MKGDLRIFESRERQVFLDYISQSVRIDQVPGMSEQANCTRQSEWKNVRATEARPNSLQCRYSFERRDTCEVARIDRTDRRADHKVGVYAGSQQHSQHTDLNRAEASASGEDKIGRAHV